MPRDHIKTKFLLLRKKRKVRSHRLVNHPFDSHKRKKDVSPPKIVSRSVSHVRAAKKKRLLSVPKKGLRFPALGGGKSSSRVSTPWGANLTENHGMSWRIGHRGLILVLSPRRSCNQARVSATPIWALVVYGLSPVSVWEIKVRLPRKKCL